MKRIISKSIFLATVLFSISFFLGSFYVETYSQEKTGSNFTPISSIEVVKDMSPGWSLGDTLDAIRTEGAPGWYNSPVEEYVFDDIKKAGFKTVRIPVTWAYHIGSAPDYKVDPKWFDRVEQVVDWALKRGFYVITEAHHDSTVWFSKMAIDPVTGEYVNDYNNQILKLEKLWQQISERFKEKSEKLIFEIINEPQYDKTGHNPKRPTNPNNPEAVYDLTPDQMNDMNMRIIKIIRSSGGYNDKRLVMVCGLSDDIKETLKYFHAPDDKYTILTVHYFYPWDFICNWWGRTTWGTESEKNYVEYIFKRLSETFVENRLPVVIGEWGPSPKIDRFSSWHYCDYIVKTAYKYDMPCIWWDEGKKFNRKERKWGDEALKDIIVNAGLGIPNSFISPADAYFKVNTDVKDDLIIKLELNGNELVNIYNGDKPVTRSYYVLDTKNSTVIINRRYLAGLLKSKGLGGVVATLKFDFSKGADLPLHIIQYDLPKISENSIVVDKTNGDIQSDMEIPVSFNGTKLATISIVDKADKRPVTTDTWTPYLRMYHHFDYTDNAIILKKELLNSLKSDSLITFEFWPKDVKVEMKAKVLTK